MTMQNAYRRTSVYTLRVTPEDRPEATMMKMIDSARAQGLEITGSGYDSPESFIRIRVADDTTAMLAADRILFDAALEERPAELSTGVGTHHRTVATN